MWLKMISFYRRNRENWQYDAILNGIVYNIRADTTWKQYESIFIHLPGVRIRNANFRQQMVHKSSLCYEDLTLRHFVVTSTSVKRAQVINWKSVRIVLCCCVLLRRYLYWTKSIRGYHQFLFSFEENCCWIISITSRSLWWTCSIARYVWTMVSAFQKWWRRHKKRKETRNMEIRQKFEDMELQALMDKSDSQI